MNPVDDQRPVMDPPASKCHHPATVQEERDPRRPAAATDAAFAGHARAIGRCHISL